MKWNQTLSVGHKTIDEQHNQLLENIDKLKELSRGEIDASEVIKITDFVKRYTVKHFSDEERMLSFYKYPDYDNHLKLHKEFIKNIDELVANIKNSNASKASVLRMQVALSSWLTTHILKEDKKYAKYIQEKGGFR